jgi:hypothetical protein
MFQFMLHITMIPIFKQFCNDFLPDSAILILATKLHKGARRKTNNKKYPHLSPAPITLNQKGFGRRSQSDGGLGMMTVIDLVAYLYYNFPMSAKKKICRR